MSVIWDILVLIVTLYLAFPFIAIIWYVIIPTKKEKPVKYGHSCYVTDGIMRNCKEDDK